MGWSSFLLAYFIGGVTFVPLVLAVVLAHAYLTLPSRKDADVSEDPTSEDDLIQPGDDVEPLKAAQTEETKPQPVHHEQEVAAGYFAVCREYTPMGINAKPIERSTPVGSATVTAPSPSVYQTMYRSIFDRKQAPGPLDNKNGANQRPKKAGNTFYVVLRHGHLMLFDDDEQLEVRHVVSLAHHNVSIYSGEPVTPEGELWIKRNAICLSRRADSSELGPDTQLSKPFYLFSENCSAKEDFYFALLRNQEQSAAAKNGAPTPIRFDVKNMISLVQKLHSSEEHLQTRWLNALVGRIFLGIHKTQDIEAFIREKLTKKISRVKRPSFLSNIAIKAIDTGTAAPYFTNPRLKDLSVEGECCVEADVRYTGNFRLEVAATARIDLGSRFKAREVNLVLAVVLRKLEGHALFKVKPPPSNRIWFSFQQMPKIEMTIEPIVSSRQITYTVIIRQIENRIKEVIAETLVLPFWDDTPFFNTEHKKWRGGIFHDDTLKMPADRESVAAQEGNLDEVERLEENPGIQEGDLQHHMEKSLSTPVLEKQPAAGLFGKKLLNKTSRTNLGSSPSVSSASLEVKAEPKGEMSSPSAISAPFTQHASPAVGIITANAEEFRPSSSPPDGNSAVEAMATLSATPQPPSPAVESNPNAFRPYITSKSPSLSSSSSSKDATESEKDADKTPQARRNTASSTESHNEHSSQSPSHSAKSSTRSQATSTSRGIFGRRDSTSSVSSHNTHESKKGTALNAVANAAASAKRWGLTAFQRRANDEGAGNHGHGHVGDNASGLDLSQPMGRGHPLPPPGTPLPMPERMTPTAAVQVPKRKPIPSSSAEHKPEPGKSSPERRPAPPPPLPQRRHYQSEQDGDDNDNGLLVVAAPADSEPTTPLSGTHSPTYARPWVEETGDTRLTDTASLSKPEETMVVDQLGIGQPLLAATTDEGPSDSGGNGTPPEAAADDDYSAWLDNTAAEEPDVPASKQVA